MAQEYPESTGPVGAKGTAPGPDPDDGAAPRNIWMRGLWMLVMAILFELGKTVLAVIALVQFVWMLVNKQKNQPIADFGVELGEWQGQVTRFLTGATEARPFPFAKWGEVA